MSHEAMSELPADGVFHEDGVINEDYVSEHYGLGIEEASQEIQFGSYNGTVAQMLADDQCPMGERVHSAYEEEGIDGVAKVFDGAAAMDPNFSVKISETTLQREKVTGTNKSSHEDDNEPPRAADKCSDSEEITETTATVSEHISDKQSEEERRAALHEEAGSEQAELETSGHTEEVEPAPQQHIDEAAIHEYEHRQVLVGTAVVPQEAAERTKEVNVDTLEPVTPPAKIIKPSMQATELTNPIPALEPQLIRKEEENVLVPTTKASAQEFNEKPRQLELVVQSEPALTPAIETDETAPLIMQTEEGEARPHQVVPVHSETLRVQLETPAQKLALNLEHVLAPETNNAEITSELRFNQKLMPEAREIAQKVSEALQSPEIAGSENVQVAVVNLMEAVEHTHELLSAGEDSVEAEELVLAACEQLLDELGIEYKVETVKQFVRLVILARASEPARAKEQLIIENPVEDEGTHESKPGQLSAPFLALRAKQKFASLRELGKWALDGSVLAV